MENSCHQTPLTLTARAEEQQRLLVVVGNLQRDDYQLSQSKVQI
jgi:hypothetical protein